MIKAKGCVPRARHGDRGRPSAGASEAHNDFWCGMSREHADGDAKLLIKFAWPYAMLSGADELFFKDLFLRRQIFTAMIRFQNYDYSIKRRGSCVHMCGAEPSPLCTSTVDIQ